MTMPSTKESSRIPRPIVEATPFIIKSTNPINPKIALNIREKRFRFPILGRVALNRDPPMVPEGPLTAKMRNDVKTLLKRYYYFYRMESFRQRMKLCWREEWMAPQLDGTNSAKETDPAVLTQLCNKATLLYWTISAQSSYIYRGPLPKLVYHCKPLIYGCLHKEWFRYRNEFWDSDFDHFVASPIRITPNGPSYLPNILQAHKALCDQTALYLSEIQLSQPKSRHYRLLPLCRAVILVLDQLAPYKEPDSDGLTRLDQESQRQSVMMVRTGDEDGLSASVSFENIREHALPLAREDARLNDDGRSAIRVSLATAVKFIADLERREDLAFPSVRDRSTMDGSPVPNASFLNYEIPNTLVADTWAESMIQRAEAEGINNVFDVKGCVLGVMEGELADDCKPAPLSHRWI